MGRTGQALLRSAVFFVALILAVFLREQGDAVDMAIIWLPTGVAVAGLWLLDLRYWWVVAAARARRPAGPVVAGGGARGAAGAGRDR